MKDYELTFGVGDWFIRRLHPDFRCQVRHIVVGKRGGVHQIQVVWEACADRPGYHKGYPARYFLDQIRHGVFELAEGIRGVL